MEYDDFSSCYGDDYSYYSYDYSTDTSYFSSSEESSFVTQDDQIPLEQPSIQSNTQNSVQSPSQSSNRLKSSPYISRPLNRTNHPGPGHSRNKMVDRKVVNNLIDRFMITPSSQTDLDTVKLCASLRNKQFDNGYVIMPAWMVRSFRNDNHRIKRFVTYVPDLSVLGSSDFQGPDRSFERYPSSQD